MCPAPHSGHGNGSNVSASLGGDEDIENVSSLFLEDLSLGVNIEPVKRQTLNHVKPLGFARAGIVRSKRLEDGRCVEDGFVHEFSCQRFRRYLTFRLLSKIALSVQSQGALSARECPWMLFESTPNAGACRCLENSL